MASPGRTPVVFQESFGEIQKPCTLCDMLDDGGRHFGQLHEVTQPLEGLQEDQQGDARGWTARLLLGECQLGQCWDKACLQLMGCRMGFEVGIRGIVDMQHARILLVRGCGGGVARRPPVNSPRAGQWHAD
jgi:hypothetical protein